MGLFGGGNTTQTTNTTNYSAEVNPQLSLGTAGEFALNVSPLAQGGSVGSIYTDADEYYAPLSIISTGDNIGDDALNTLAGISETNLQTVTNPNQTGLAGTASQAINSIFSGDNLYWILGAIVLLLLAHHKG